jgi:hypothetical protein
MYDPSCVVRAAMKRLVQAAAMDGPVDLARRESGFCAGIAEYSTVSLLERIPACIRKRCRLMILRSATIHPGWWGRWLPSASLLAFHAAATHDLSMHTPVPFGDKLEGMTRVAATWQGFAAKTCR